MDKYRGPICSNKQKFARCVKQSVKIKFVNLDVQSEESPSVVTEDPGNDMICVAGI